ncbi:uncharacterized protein BT62DRAFT_1008293 [Guyanagaster necrorhizus]|uniref:HNH nuclease domain-containing protein n=1 Tax=Guyanagaster necrorhizus TaxID=856835 RepID=A0A9P7VP83_9AGAR|nr:uncharacterized protein BT62DRAFT_1008293 [Guyanagaster necrorhizus MCA 3950]KAG7444087.1 hypothetical protein BT62DRAFT_1008293 [Guyanagaster necrorhizus MCA 3950]
MRKQVLRREGFRCPLTGVAESGHDLLPPERTKLLCALSVDFVCKPNYFGQVTWDILRNYMAAPPEELNDPSNWIAFETNIHTHFDTFRLSLKKTERNDLWDTVGRLVASTYF